MSEVNGKYGKYYNPGSLASERYIKEKQYLTNHFGRKTITLVKKLKKHQVAKSDIIKITGHNNERGLDVYDSGDEEQQKHLYRIIESKA